jgi:hypothetical protein
MRQISPALSNTQATRVIQLTCLCRKQHRFPLGTPGSSPASEATLERGAPRDNQAETEN